MQKVTGFYEHANRLLTPEAALKFVGAVTSCHKGHAIDRRVLEPVEAQVMVPVGVLLMALAILFSIFSRLFVYPLIVGFVWIAVALLDRGYKLRRRNGHREKVERDVAGTMKEEQG